MLVLAFGLVNSIFYVIDIGTFVPIAPILSTCAGYVFVYFDLGGEAVVGTENPAFTYMRNN